MYFVEILKLKLFFISVIISTFLLGEDCVKATDTSRITVAGGSITEILYMLDAEEKIVNREEKLNHSVTKDKFNIKIKNIKNDKIKKSLIELTKIFREK